MGFDEWLSVGEMLKAAEKSVLWWIGDWLNYGERTYGETYAQVVNPKEYSNGTLRNAKWVAGRIELSRRRDSLPWSHHYEVAVTPNPIDSLLASGTRWSAFRGVSGGGVGLGPATAYRYAR